MMSFGFVAFGFLALGCSADEAIPFDASGEHVPALFLTADPAASIVAIVEFVLASIAMFKSFQLS